METLDSAHHRKEDNTQATNTEVPANPIAEQTSDLQNNRHEALHSEVYAIIRNFNIHMADSIVEVTIPPTTSKYELLERIHNVTNALYGKPAVAPETLASWSKEESFTETKSSSIKILLNGNVAGSTNMSRLHQKSKGLNDVILSDLAVAHAAYLLVNEDDLFKGNAVRAKEGQLLFSQDGLTTKTFFGEAADPNVAASKTHSWTR